jgi:Flp pilus assembly protein TadB
MNALIAILGVGLGVGVYLVLSGLAGDDHARRAVPVLPPPLRTAAIRAVGCGAIVFALTRWPVAAIACGAMAWFAPDLLGGKAAREEATARTEAIASWTEMLRDTIASAHGLESAITATAPIAPVAIRPEIRALAATIERRPLPEALTQLAVDLDHPIGDLVVAALSMAATGSVRDLADLLGELASTARDEAAMELRVEAGRARIRTAVRVITGCTVATAVGLIVLNPDYVDVYATPLGQVTLAVIASCWGVSLWWLTQMSRFQRPERFLLPSAESIGGSR